MFSLLRRWLHYSLQLERELLLSKADILILQLRRSGLKTKKLRGQEKNGKLVGNNRPNKKQ